MNMGRIEAPERQDFLKGIKWLVEGGGNWQWCQLFMEMPLMPPD